MEYDRKYGGVCASPGQSTATKQAPTWPVKSRMPLAEELSSEIKAKTRRTLAAHQADFRRCYADALSGWPDARGTVEVVFLLTPEGLVDKAGVRSNTTGVKALECCISEVVRSLRFERTTAERPLIVDYPVVFARPDAKAGAN